MTANNTFLSIIAAMDIQGLIGNRNGLPWPRIQSDMDRFLELTRCHDVVMGRKTFESLKRPLPRRHNIVLSRGTIYTSLFNSNYTVVSSLARAIAATKLDPEIFVIGGAGIYKLVLPHAQRMYITTVHRSYSGDTYFPEWDKNEWTKKESRSVSALGEIATSFSIWERKKAPAPL